MATNSVNRSVNIFIETGDAQKAFDRLIAKEKEFKDQLASATNPAQIKKLQAEIDKLQEPISRSSKKISGELSPSLRDMGTSIGKLANELKNLSKEDPSYNKKLLQLKTATLEYDKQKAAVSGLTHEHESASNSFFEFAKRIAEGVGVYKVADFAIEKTVELAKGIVEETLQAEAANSKLKNILDNLGRADVFESLKKSAEELTDTFKAVKDEEIINSFAQLATYGKLSENQIKALEPVIINFARKSGLSIEESTSTIIKSLEGNGKALKEYGINIKEGQNVTERFGIIMQELKPRVEGAELAFEKTGAGFGAKFKESIAGIQKDIGSMISKLIEGKKSADELFDEAKVKNENYERSLVPLVSRYDELKNKTSLNKQEQQELQGIIQRIGEIIPDSVTAFNSYGVALDINRGKVTSFLETNKKFLSEKEADAVRSLTEDALDNVKLIANFSKDLSKGGVTGTFGDFFKFTDKERENATYNLRKAQEDIISEADKLTNKYGKELPESVRKAVEAIKAEFSSIEKTAPKGSDEALNRTTIDSSNSVEKLRERIKSVDAEFEKLDITNKKAIESNRKNRAELQKQLDELEGKKDKKSIDNQFADDLQKLLEQQSKVSDINKTEFEKKLGEAQRQYDAFQALFDKQLQKQELSQAQHDELMKQAHENLVEQDHQLRLAEIKRAYDEQEKADKKLADDRLKNFLEAQGRIAHELAARADQALGQRTAEAELNVLKATGRKKLAAQRAQLDLEEQIALGGADAIGKKRELIEEQFRQKRKKLDTESLISGLQDYANYINQLSSTLQNFFSIQNQAAQADIDRESNANEKKKASYQKQLDGKLITQKEYQRKVDALDNDLNKKQNALKLKQFNQDKVLSIARATANVAESITKMLTAGPFIGQVLAGIAAALGLYEIGIIAKQQPPKFARGGFVPDGPSHAQRGIKLVDGRTGQLRGEIEGGEPILSRATYRNNRSLVDALLNASMNQGGAALQPTWRNAPISHLDYAGIQQSLSNYRVHATGGILPQTAAISDQADQSNQVQLAMLAAINNLNNQLAAGITARASLRQINDEQTRLNNIIDDSRGK
jgi:hypothetical protein